MRKNILSLLYGFLFAIGLGISGMTDPAKVIAFLNVGENWDATLLFVMAGGLTVYAINYRFILPRVHKPVLEEKFHLPTRSDIDAPLIIGAASFGVGWGFLGYCPGPALASLGGGDWSALYFIAGMSIGMIAIPYLKDESKVSLLKLKRRSST